MNSLHCLFHLRTTHTNYFPAIKLSLRWQSLIRSTPFLGYLKNDLMYSTSQLFLSVLILVKKTKSTIALQHLLPHATLQTISEGLYPTDFVGLKENTAWYHIQQPLIFQNEHQPNEGFTSGKQHYGSFFCVQQFNLHWFMLAQLSWTAKFKHYKRLPSSLITATHGDTTECASLSGSYCVTTSPLLKIEEIQPRSKIGQNLCQQAVDQRE